LFYFYDFIHDTNPPKLIVNDFKPVVNKHMLVFAHLEK